MKISIIIPCYNVQDSIDRCVKSLVVQTIGLEYMELILVDDASTDHTMERLSFWESQYPENILVVHCDENGRQGTARNIGLSYASGDYIGFVDGDDWVDPDMYEVLSQLIQQYSCQIAGVLYQRQGEDGTVYSTGSQIEDGRVEYSVIDNENQRKIFLRQELPGGICTKLFLAKFLRDSQVVFPEKLSYEDNFFGGVLKFCITSYVICHRVMYHYMVNTSSTTMQSGIRHFDRLKIEMMKYEELCKRGYLQTFHDEIEFDFIKLYFCNSLALFFTKLPEIPYDMIEVMKKTIHVCFPEYSKNAYIQQLGETDKVFLSILNQNLGREDIEKIADWYRQAVIEYFKSNHSVDSI